jgi:hypothetical protein
MDALYGLTQTEQNISTSIGGSPSIASRKKSRTEEQAVFNALSLKEKCLYLMKISKRNTAYQTLVLTGLSLSVIAVDYLFSMII